MEIELNGEKLDFTLEKEKNLLDIVEGLEQWLRDSSMVITDLHIGEKALYHEPRKNWAVFPVEKIDKIVLSALPIREVLVNSIYTVKEYLILLANAIHESDTKTMEQLKTGYAYLLESITHLFNNCTVTSTKNEINYFLDFFSALDLLTLNKLNEAAKNQILTNTDKMLIKLDELLETELDPVKALLKIRTTLKKSIEEIREVSLHLQTGKDRNAMDSIIHFSDQMQRMLYLFRKLKSVQDFRLANTEIAGQSIEVFYNAFNNVLKELVEAFAGKDYVLIGDLLEYEVAPRLESVIEFIEKIGIIKGEVNK